VKESIDCPMHGSTQRTQHVGESEMCGWCWQEIYFEGGWELAHALNEMFDRTREAHLIDLWEIWEKACSCDEEVFSCPACHCRCPAKHMAGFNLEYLLGANWHAIMAKRTQ